MRKMRSVSWFAVTAVLGLTAAAGTPGCGGAPSEGGTTGVKTSGGDTIKSASGQGVSAAAHDHWKDGNAKFAKYEKQGWSGGNCSDAKSDFADAASAQGGKFAEAIYMEGLVADRCGDHDAAAALYNKALSVGPKLCSARAAVGLDQMERGNVSQAATTFQLAITNDNQCTPAYVNLAIIQRGQGGAAVEEALKNLRRALAVDSNYLPAYNQMALLYLEEAKLGKKEALDLAQVVCRQAQLIDGNYAPIYNTWGLISMQTGNVIEALRFFEKAAALDPSLFEAFMNFGTLTHSFRGYDDAQKSFAKAVELKPNDYDAHIGLGAALRGQKKANEAKAEYEKAVKLNANRPEAYFDLGVLYQDYMSGEVSDLGEAKKYFSQFVSRSGDGNRYKPQLDEVQRRCDAATAKKKRKRSTDCRPGRLQNIDNSIEALNAAAAMQQKAAK